MGFAGHVMDMICRMKQNETIKSSRRYKYKKIKGAYFEEIGSHHVINNLIDISHVFIDPGITGTCIIII